MFIDKNDDSAHSGFKEKFWDLANDTRTVKVVAVAVILAVLVGIFLIYLSVEANKKRIKTPVANNNKPSNNLGPWGNFTNGDEPATSTVNIRAESLFFGNFYQHLVDNFTPTAQGLALPTNIKELAANYYAVDREISLVNAFGQINQNGFAVIDNPLPKEAKDFYSFYSHLNDKNLAYIITNDFMLYYYQNSLKNIFKQIESELFYREFWDINQAMFNNAYRRYRERYAKVGIINDPVLEGLRLESVYFATMLEIIKPKPKQIIAKSKDNLAEKEYFQKYFNNQEAETFVFTPPDDLQASIQREMDLIVRSFRVGKPTRSPALLYTRDYNDFNVPKVYETNQRLYNFYLAMAWANSLFPLYYQSPDCPECLLDKEDWLVNQAAAHLIARDFSANQEMKNRWAKIYKTLGFINNLSSELTYLDYHNSFVSLFGDAGVPAADKIAQELLPGETEKARSVEEVFDFANKNREADLQALRDKIGQTKFDAYKGGLDRATAKGQQASGMRMLQVPFQPDMFVYNQLLYDNVGLHKNYDGRTRDLEIVTACNMRLGVTVRCRPFGLDIINAVFNEPIKWSYFTKNTAYQYYGNQAPLIRQHFNSFDNTAWNLNLYWSTLDASRYMLNERRVVTLPYTQTEAWASTTLDTAQSALVASQVPVDLWSWVFRKDTKLQTEESMVKYNYVEPNLALINELLAKTKMVFQVFIGLDLVKTNDDNFRQLTNDWQQLKNIAHKELSGQEFSYEEYTFLNELTTRYYLTDLSDKELRFYFDVPETKSYRRLRQSVDGLQVMIAAHHHQGRDLVLVGPMFNFKEIGD